MPPDRPPPERFDQPPPEPLASAIGFLLSWNGQRTAHEFARALEPLDLRPPHFGVMTLIEAHPGSTQNELVTGSLIDPSSMVAVIDELEELGLAERRRHPSDRRKHAVHLTTKGKRRLARAQEAATTMIERLLEPLDQGERETLRVLLRKLARVHKPG
ncbi:MAG: MarR family winged helix-turn-helix transcriptional regulator [Solirubrobacterales bacterium]